MRDPRFTDCLRVEDESALAYGPLEQTGSSLGAGNSTCAARWDYSLPVIRLHYYPGNASLAPHMLLRELALPFELCLVDRRQDAQQSAEYLRLNPNGRIPTLVDGDLVLWEAAAICLHLLDRHAQRMPSPALGTPERAQLYKWLFWLSNTLQPELMTRAYPERWSTLATDEVVTRSCTRLDAMFDLAEAALDPYLLGARFSAVDLYFLMLCLWGRAMPNPPQSRPRTARLMAELLARPAVQAALAAERAALPV